MKARASARSGRSKGLYGFARGVGPNGLPRPLMRYTWLHRIRLHRLMGYDERAAAIKRMNGARGGRPAHAPSDEEILQRFGDRWLGNSKEGPGPARAWLVKKLAAEYRVEERQAQRWLQGALGYKLKRRNKRI